jgi:serine/threonine protein kinase
MFDSKLEGTQIGSYRLFNLIGQGGMGKVFKGRHINDVKADMQGGDVAIKLMHSQYASNPVFIERFNREASLGIRLGHPNLVRVFDLLQEGNALALVMELVQGNSLEIMIDQQVGPIPWERSSGLFFQATNAVHFAHSKGVIHRDLKPENIMIAPNGTVKILDFGIAKDLHDSKTKTGTRMGTVDYMAPEQFLDAKDVDHRADVYALGLTLYEMVAGRLPWLKTDTEFSIMSYKDKGNLPPPTEFYPHIPAFVVEAIKIATQRQKQNRFQSVQQFEEYLRNGKVVKTMLMEDVTYSPTKQMSSNLHSTEQTPASPNKTMLVGNPPPHSPPSQATGGNAKWIVGMAMVVVLAFVAGKNQSDSVTETVTSSRQESKKSSPKAKAVSTSNSNNKTADPVPKSRRITVTDWWPYTDSRYSVRKALDGIVTDSSWCSEYPTSFTLSFGTTYTITELRIVNGRQKVKNDKYGDRFYYNHRAKSIKLRSGNGDVQTVGVRDQKSSQVYDLQNLTGRTLEFDVQNYYFGDGNSPQICISEIEIYGY